MSMIGNLASVDAVTEARIRKNPAVIEDLLETIAD